MAQYDSEQALLEAEHLAAVTWVAQRTAISQRQSRNDPTIGAYLGSTALETMVDALSVANDQKPEKVKRDAGEEFATRGGSRRPLPHF